MKRRTPNRIVGGRGRVWSTAGWKGAVAFAAEIARRGGGPRAANKRHGEFAITVQPRSLFRNMIWVLLARGVGATRGFRWVVSNDQSGEEWNIEIDLHRNRLRRPRPRTRPWAGAYSRSARMAATGRRASFPSRPARRHCRAQGARQSRAVVAASTNSTFRARDNDGCIATGRGVRPPGATTSQERSQRARDKRKRRAHQPPLGCLLSMMSVTGPTLTRLTFIMLPKTHSVGRVTKQGDTRSNSNHSPQSGQFCCARG